MNIQTRNTTPVCYSTKTYSNGETILLSVDWVFNPGDSVCLVYSGLLKVTKPDGSVYFLVGEERDRA